MIHKDYSDFASHAWRGDDNNILEVDAPIAVHLEGIRDTPRNDKENKESSVSLSMMHRTVCNDGKSSVSRFRHIAYDKNTDQSLILCCPITGRGHQLRVHLQLIGFPIHNDIDYGGVLDNVCMQNQKELAIQSILDVAASTPECFHEKSICADEIKSAMKLCKCCRDGKEGVKSSFNSAQLLGGGHAIDLHALKYRILFGDKLVNSDESNKETRQSEDETSMEFSTGVPQWASSFEGLLMENLTWMN